MELRDLELNDLVGTHMLSGVDMNTASVDECWFDRCDYNVINFVLDGKTYTAMEDPCDGYRSMMKEIIVSEFVVSNVFPPQEVLGVMDHEPYKDIIHFIDTTTKKIVLSLGTDDYDDYYPMWVGVFTPENMAINQGR